MNQEIKHLNRKTWSPKKPDLKNHVSCQMSLRILVFKPFKCIRANFLATHCSQNFSVDPNKGRLLIHSMETIGGMLQREDDCHKIMEVI